MTFFLRETISNLFCVVTCLLGPQSTRLAMFMALKSKSLLSQRMSPWLEWLAEPMTEKKRELIVCHEITGGDTLI